MEFKEVRLETERLILRWFRADDSPAYLTMAQDPEVMKFLTGEPQTEIEAWKNMAAHIGHWYFRGYGTWAVEEKASGRVVGRRYSCQSRHPARETRRAEEASTAAPKSFVGGSLAPSGFPL